MMIAVKSVTFIGVLALALQAAPVLAADPTQSDFDACNKVAQAKLGNPSASPQTGGATGPAITSPAGTPDTTSGVQPGGQSAKTGPMITGSGRTPESPGGVREGTGAVSSGAGATSSAAGSPSSAPSASPTTGATSSGAGAVSSNSADMSSPQLRGISEAMKGDVPAREAYRQCMQQRGF
jgi:hypothetical protein